MIFFYDNIQLKNINEDKIKNLIKAYKYKFKNNENIPIHLFIVYTLPTISNISLYDLSKNLQLIKEEEIKRENVSKNLVNEINNLRSEMEKVKLSQVPQSEQKSINIIDDKNNNIKENKTKNIYEYFGLFNNNKNENNNFSLYDNITNINNVNNNINSNKSKNENLNNDIFNFIDNINSKNSINNENLNINEFNFIDNINSNNPNINNIDNSNSISNNNINESKNNDLIIFED